MTALLNIGVFMFFMFIGMVMSTVLGGLVGWTVGMVFPEVFDTLSQLTGLNVSPWQWGATLGFVGSFLRSASEKK